jgi:hypothetical protein
MTDHYASNPEDRQYQPTTPAARPVRAVRVHIDPAAMPNYHQGGDMYFEWPNNLDDLVRFIQGNQGPLFAEDAALFVSGDRYVIRRDVPEVWRRVRASWEDGPNVLVALSAEMIQTIIVGLEDSADRMEAQQSITHDYTDDEILSASRRRQDVLHAIGRELGTTRLRSRLNLSANLERIRTKHERSGGPDEQELADMGRSS